MVEVQSIPSASSTHGPQLEKVSRSGDLTELLVAFGSLMIKSPWPMGREIFGSVSLLRTRVVHAKPRSREC